MNKGILFVLKNNLKQLNILIVRKKVKKFNNIELDYQILDSNEKVKNLIHENVGSKVNLNFINEKGEWEIEKKYYCTENLNHLYDVSSLNDFVKSLSIGYKKNKFISKDLLDRYKNDIFLDSNFWNHDKINLELSGEIIDKYWELDPIDDYPTLEPYNTLLNLADDNFKNLNIDFILNYWGKISKKLRIKLTKEIDSGNISLDDNIFSSNKFWSDNRLTKELSEYIISRYFWGNYKVEKYSSIEPYRSLLKLMSGEKLVITRKIINFLDVNSTEIIDILNIFVEINKFDFEDFEVYIDYFLLTSKNYLLVEIYKKIRELAKKSKTNNNTDELFIDFHSEIINLLKKEALDNNKEINIKPLIPECVGVNKLTYCEGNIFEKYGFSYWCRNKGCEIPKISKNTNLNKQEWSLLEIFDYYLINIDFNNTNLWQMKHFNSLNDYVRKIGGALNRLNEIRERLKCRRCGEMMSFDWKYPIHDAAYKLTVAECENSKCDEQGNGVYLNHCWACGNIIDGRDNIITIDDYKLCLKCGSGPQKSRDYSQGDICPKCGSRDIESKNNNKYYTCNNCYHSIKIPPPNKITGLN